MKISTKGRYALRILADIAEHGVEKNVPIREIAERQGFSDKYLEGIVSRLSSAGLVKSGRGKYGGYRLVKLPAEYNVYEILYAAEDSIVEPCPMFNDCLTAPLWQYLQDEFRHVMERVSLQDVMDHKFPTE